MSASLWACFSSSCSTCGRPSEHLTHEDITTIMRFIYFSAFREDPFRVDDWTRKSLKDIARDPFYTRSQIKMNQIPPPPPFTSAWCLTGLAKKNMCFLHTERRWDSNPKPQRCKSNLLSTKPSCHWNKGSIVIRNAFHTINHQSCLSALKINWKLHPFPISCIFTNCNGISSKGKLQVEADRYDQNNLCSYLDLVPMHLAALWSRLGEK